MTRLLLLTSILTLLSGCGFGLPNGVFACLGASDCPTGFSCWNSDGRCHDVEEPVISCQPASCEEVASQFAAVGVVVECGTLPDGCDGFVECPPCDEGDTCGANGQSFICGCEPATCSRVGAECGEVPVGCGLEGTVGCGECPGALACGADNRCACPPGQDCDEPCGGCFDGQVCVDGECCNLTYPCSDNECSPPGGLPNGCGALVDCGRCTGADTCELEPASLRFACVDDCTCEAQGRECGTLSTCGSPQVCGFCGGSTPICDDGRCICTDLFEPNDTPNQAEELACQGSCSVGATHAEAEGTIDDEDDLDFYILEVPHREDRAVRVDLDGLQSKPRILLTYICPDGSQRISDCSGSSSSVGSAEYCIEDDNEVLRLVQECAGGNGAPARLIIGIGAKEGEFKGPCDSYAFSVSSYSYDD